MAAAGVADESTSTMFARKGTVIRKKRRSLSRCQASRRRSVTQPGAAIPLSTPTAWTRGSPATPVRTQRSSSQSSNGRLSIYDTFVQLKVGSFPCLTYRHTTLSRGDGFRATNGWCDMQYGLGRRLRLRGMLKVGFDKF